jgi:hypothetical protein
MAEEKLSPSRPGDKEAENLAYLRRLEGWFLKRDRLRRVLVNQAPLTASDYNNSDVIRVEILAIDEAILHTLASIANEEKMSEFYKSLAHFLADLRRKPVPSFIRNAHKISAAKFEVTGIRPKRKKSGTPRAMTSGQVGPLMEIDAIARLVEEGFIPSRGLTRKLYEKLALERGQLLYRRQQIQPNPRVEEIRSEFRDLPRHERVEEAERRLVSAISKFRRAERPRKSRSHTEK